MLIKQMIGYNAVLLSFTLKPNLWTDFTQPIQLSHLEVLGLFMFRNDFDSYKNINCNFYKEDNVFKKVTLCN